jgi:hypothetical protein
MHQELSDEEVKALAMEAFQCTWDADDETLVNKYGHGVYLWRFADFARAVIAADRAKRVPMTEQISDGEFEPSVKLVELADRIDHEQNWRRSGIFQRDHLTQDQKDRLQAGVMLRRYAALMAPDSWRLFPPKAVASVSFRASTLDGVVKMAEREQDRAAEAFHGIGSKT